MKKALLIGAGIIVVILIFAGVFLFRTTDEDRMKECENVVITMMHDLEMQNFNSVRATYPAFSEISQYYIPGNFELVSSNIDKDKTVTVFGKYKRVSEDNWEKLKFVLDTQEGEYKVISTKGLCFYYDQPIFEYCKQLGYLVKDGVSIIESDAAISTICEEKESEFKRHISEYVEYMEDAFEMDKNLSAFGFMGSYALYCSGNIVVRNPTKMNLYAGTFKLNMVVAKRNLDVLAQKPITFFGNIPSKSSVNVEIPYMDLPRSFDKYVVQLDIVSTKYIENEFVKDPIKYIAEKNFRMSGFENTSI